MSMTTIETGVVKILGWVHCAASNSRKVFTIFLGNLVVGKTRGKLWKAGPQSSEAPTGKDTHNPSPSKCYDPASCGDKMRAMKIMYEPIFEKKADIRTTRCSFEFQKNTIKKYIMAQPPVTKSISPTSSKLPTLKKARILKSLPKLLHL